MCSLGDASSSNTASVELGTGPPSAWPINSRRPAGCKPHVMLKRSRCIICGLTIRLPMGELVISGVCAALKLRMRLMNIRSTLYPFLEDTSMNKHPYCRERCKPSSFDTSRSYVLSHSFPTRMNSGLVFLTRSIWPRKIPSLLKVEHFLIE